MAEDWQKQRTDITNDLRNDGIEFTIKRKGASIYDPISGQYLSNDEEQTFTAYGIFKSLSYSGVYSSNYGFSWMQDVTIERGDKIVLLDGSTYSPELEDVFILATGEYTVKAWSLLEPGGVAIIQYILLRKV